VHELEVIAGPDRGVRHALPDGEPQLLGRSTESLGSRDPTVSRRHAELTPSDGRWWISDLRSTHGTLVNGQRVLSRTALRDGDRVRCGETEFMFHAPGGVRGVHAAGGAGEGGGPDAAEATAVHADPERLRAIGETVATLSHSVKNILQGLRSGADAVELALGKGDVDMARQGWPIVARNLDRISWLVMNMLAFAKDRPLEIAETDLAALVRDVCDLMQATGARRRVKLVADVEDGLPPAPVDANAVHQILMNLVANAVEAAPDRTGRVRVRASLDGPRGVFVIEVEDDGAGVPAAQRAWLFAAFASTKGQRGTGLGLAVALKLAQQHGGTIEHRDAPRQGTIMRVELPAERDDPDAEKTRGPKASGRPAIEFE
jgi:signal transduction histidine kinase